ncbi:MAG: MBL fold metallo-hydrolase [Acidobacteria bacterium]|jgi:hydroxyacylglutathione hydrolase|nr:MBL fold metallo-hydrolase [Acidobacteriota bacterium]
MLIERFEDKGLAQYSYAVACEGQGVCAIVDPRRDVDVYLEFAAARGLAIAHVLETHIHADFASGARELAARTGAALRLSAYDEGELYETAFPHIELRDGDAIAFGAVRMVARHTPGHTPEHVSFLVYDQARAADVPMVMLSGDFLFVGSLGRPDLLGDAATLALAKRLYQSVATVLPGLPDGLEIAPGHGAGSMCGAGMSGRPGSTLGFERAANPYLRPLTEAAFVELIVGTVPPFPDYYRRMKVLNAAGPPSLNGLPGLVALPAGHFRDLAARDHVVVDLRDQLSFGAGHIPGAFGIGAGQSLSTWASWVVPYDRPLLLVGADQAQLDDAVRSLVRVGLDNVRGYLAGGIDSWVKVGWQLAHTPQIAPEALAARLAGGEAIRVLDVRNASEWNSGHIEGARHIMAGHLPAHVGEFRDGPPVAIVCGGGYRSTVAASILERAGITNLMNVTGGMNAWRAAGRPVVS